MSERGAQLERLISELADGGLDDAARARVAAAAAADPRAARLVAQYARLDRLLRVWRPFPETQLGAGWATELRARIADDRAAALAGLADASIDESAARQVALRYASDGAAQKIEAGFRNTDDALAGWRTLPDVDWNALHERISAAVRGAAAERRRRFAWGRWLGVAGLAAVIALTALVALRPRRVTPPVTPAVAPDVVVKIESPRSDGQVAVHYDMGKPPADVQALHPPTESGRSAAITPTTDDVSALP
ncbi:MAG: hypothetical protein U1A27_04470 [Phycisphaerae bacterium]